MATLSLAVNRSVSHIAVAAMGKYPNVYIETGCGKNGHWKIIQAILLQTVKMTLDKSATKTHNTTDLLLALYAVAMRKTNTSMRETGYTRGKVRDDARYCQT